MNSSESSKKLEWQEYLRSGATNRHLYPVYNALINGIKKHFNTNIRYFSAFFNKNTLYWYYEKNDLYNFGEKIIEKFLSSNTFKKEFFKEWDNKSLQILNIIKNNSIDNIRNMNNQEITDFYKKFSKLITEWYDMTMCIDGTDEYLMINCSEKIKNILRHELKNNYSEKQFIEAYNILTQPSKLSYLNDERKLILEVVQITKQKNSKLLQKNVQKKLNKLITDFWWTALGWQRDEPKKIDDFKKEIESISKSGTDTEYELKAIENYKKNTFIAKKEIIKKFRFDQDKDLMMKLRLIDELFIYHDKRKEIQMKYNFYEYKLFDLISNRTKINSQLLEWCFPEEIIDLIFKNKFDSIEIKKRSEYFLYSCIDNKINIQSGNAASELHKKLQKGMHEEIKDIQGMGASPGKVVAKAFVALNIDDTKDMKQGDVLVTGMTTPDFVPAMRKAAAIITDEGGITCHAAIVSRELRIPCIVGTKIATKTIKTGDIIEVAATHGIVKIIEHKSTTENNK